MIVSQNGPAFDPATWRLVVDGTVSCPLRLSPEELLGLPRDEVRGALRPYGGPAGPEIRWEGVRVPALLARARPLPGAEFITVHAGDYTIVLSLTAARHPGLLLATHMNGQPLAAEHGAPMRLAVPLEWYCFSSAKWVQRLELTERPANATGPSTALWRVARCDPPHEEVRQ